MRAMPNSAEIRQFLTDTFSHEELVTLCFDYFRDVYNDFAPAMSTGQKIQLLIERCDRRGILPNLLAAIQRARPEQYKQQFPQAAKPEAYLETTKPVYDPRQIFISHAHEDAEFAHRLSADLQQRGWQVWIAPDSIRPGEKWIEAVNRGLGESGVFALVLTPSAVKSRWVKDETNIAIEYEHEGHLRFVPLMVESCDVLPLWRVYQRVSFQNDYVSGLTALLDALEPERRVQPESEQQVTKRSCRIDAAAPSHAQVGQKIELLVQVRFPNSPLLGIKDWPTKQKPTNFQQVSETVKLEFPVNPQTRKLEDTRLEIRIVAPDFKIEGEGRQLVEVPPHQYSKCVSFLLTTIKLGVCRINIEVYNLDHVYLGMIPVETAVDDAIISPVAMVASLSFTVTVAPGYFIFWTETAREEAEQLEHEREAHRQKRAARLERLLAKLRNPLWQGIGAIAAIAAVVAMGAWLWPNVHAALFPPPTPTEAAAPTATAPTATITPPLAPSFTATPPSTASPTTAPTRAPSPSHTPTITASVTATALPTETPTGTAVMIMRPTIMPTPTCSGSRNWNGTECVCPPDKPDWLGGTCIAHEPPGRGNTPEQPPPPKL